VPPSPPAVAASALIDANRRLAGSLIGGIRETQEMLDFCAEQSIASDIEVIAAAEINQSYERMSRVEVRYRFVIDVAKTLEVGAR
jgi:uncharacterized zinc-type alcohol dehydrogenase-like protein